MDAESLAHTEMNTQPQLTNTADPLQSVDNISRDRAHFYYPSDPLFEARRDLFPLPQGDIEYGTPGWGHFSSAASALNTHQMSATMHRLREHIGTYNFSAGEPAIEPHQLAPQLLVILDLARVYHAKAAKAAQQGWYVPDTTPFYAIMSAFLERITAPGRFHPTFGRLPRHGLQLTRLARTRADKEFALSNLLKQQELAIQREFVYARGEPSTARPSTPRTCPLNLHLPSLTIPSAPLLEHTCPFCPHTAIHPDCEVREASDHLARVFLHADLTRELDRDGEESEREEAEYPAEYAGSD